MYHQEQGLTLLITSPKSLGEESLQDFQQLTLLRIYSIDFV